MRWSTLTLLGSVVLVGCPEGGGSGGTGVPDGGASTEAGSGTSSSSGGPKTPLTQTVGPDLAAPIEAPKTPNTFGCNAGFPVQTNPTFPQPFLSPGFPSCSVVTFVVDTTSKIDLPRKGTAVSASILVPPGTPTGRMRFLRMRILLQNPNPPKCCSVEQYGAEFTPAVGTPLTVPLDFPMTFDSVPKPEDKTTIALNDLIAIEVLEPDVPVPGYWILDGGATTYQNSPVVAASYMWLPSLSAQQIKAPTSDLPLYQGSYSGFLPLFNYVLSY